MTNIKYVGCKVIGCLEKHRSRGFCRKHYRLFMGEGKKRYQTVKNDATKLAKTKECIERYKSTEAFRKSKSKSDKKYYEKNRKEISEYRKKLRDTYRFGGLKEKVLQRDNYKCTLCGTDKRLVVHHKNGIGRNSDNPDNRIDNLVTLCRSCHFKIHKLL